MRGERFAAFVRAVTRRPLVVIAIVGALGLAGAVLALGLEPRAGTDTLVSPSSDVAKATDEFKHDFGDEAVVVLVKGDLQRTVLTPDLGRLIKLEGCLSRQRSRRGAARSCRRAARSWRSSSPPRSCSAPARSSTPRPARSPTSSPAAAPAATRQANEAAEAAQKLSAKRGDPPARQQELAAARAQAGQRALHPGGAPDRAALRDQRPALGRQPRLRLDARLRHPRGREAGPDGVPKSRFAYLFPSPNAALIQVRLKPGLSDSDRGKAIDLIKEVTADKSLKPQRGARVRGLGRAGGGRGACRRGPRARSSCCSARPCC